MHTKHIYNNNRANRRTAIGSENHFFPKHLYEKDILQIMRCLFVEFIVYLEYDKEKVCGGIYNERKCSDFISKAI